MSLVLLLAGSLRGPVCLALDLGHEPARSRGVVEPPSSVATPLFGRGDALFGLATAGAVLFTLNSDTPIQNEMTESHAHRDRVLARAAQPWGNPAVVLPALAVGYGLSKIAGRPRWASGFAEVATSVVAASASAVALKEIAGRSRPSDAPLDSGDFHPFSGNASFPSGHTAVAFALAEGLRLQAPSRWWVPWIVYPSATAVGWSRIRDEHHWTTDVIAGAALGAWTAHKVHRLWSRGEDRGGIGFEFGPGGAPELCLRLRCGVLGS